MPPIKDWVTLRRFEGERILVRQVGNGYRLKAYTRAGKMSTEIIAYQSDLDTLASLGYTWDSPSGTLAKTVTRTTADLNREWGSW